MKPTVRTLLERDDLALTLRTDEASLPDGALDAPVPWVHSSDLADPAPFLPPFLILCALTLFFAVVGPVAAAAALRHTD